MLGEGSPIHHDEEEINSTTTSQENSELTETENSDTAEPNQPKKRWYHIGRGKQKKAPETQQAPEEKKTFEEMFKEGFPKEYDQAVEQADGDPERLNKILKEKAFLIRARELAGVSDEELAKLNPYIETGKDRKDQFKKSTGKRAIVKLLVAGGLIVVGAGVAAATGGTLIPAVGAIALKAFGLGAFASFGAGTLVDAKRYLWSGDDPNKKALAELIDARSRGIRDRCQRIVRTANDGYIKEGPDIINLQRAKADLFEYVTALENPDSDINKEIVILKKKIIESEKGWRRKRMAASILAGVLVSVGTVLSSLKELTQNIEYHGFEMQGDGLGGVVKDIQEFNPGFQDQTTHFVKRVAEDATDQTESGVAFNIDDDTHRLVHEAVDRNPGTWESYNDFQVEGQPGYWHEMADSSAFTQMAGEKAQELAGATYGALATAFLVDGIADAKATQSVDQAYFDPKKMQRYEAGTGGMTSEAVSKSLDYESSELGIGKPLVLKHDYIQVGTKKKENGEESPIIYSKDNKFILDSYSEGKYYVMPCDKNYAPVGEPFPLKVEDFKKQFDFEKSSAEQGRTEQARPAGSVPGSGEGEGTEGERARLKPGAIFSPKEEFLIRYDNKEDTLTPGNEVKIREVDAENDRVFIDVMEDHQAKNSQPIEINTSVFLKKFAFVREKDVEEEDKDEEEDGKSTEIKSEDLKVAEKWREYIGGEVDIKFTGSNRFVMHDQELGDQEFVVNQDDANVLFASEKSESYTVHDIFASPNGVEIRLQAEPLPLENYEQIKYFNHGPSADEVMSDFTNSANELIAEGKEVIIRLNDGDIVVLDSVDTSDPQQTKYWYRYQKDHNQEPRWCDRERLKEYAVDWYVERTDDGEGGEIEKRIKDQVDEKLLPIEPFDFTSYTDDEGTEVVFADVDQAQKPANDLAKSFNKGISFRPSPKPPNGVLATGVYSTYDPADQPRRGEDVITFDIKVESFPPHEKLGDYLRAIVPVSDSYQISGFLNEPDRPDVVVRSKNNELFLVEEYATQLTGLIENVTAKRLDEDTLRPVSDDTTTISAVDISDWYFKTEDEPQPLDLGEPAKDLEEFTEKYEKIIKPELEKQNYDDIYIERVIPFLKGIQQDDSFNAGEISYNFPSERLLDWKTKGELSENLREWLYKSFVNLRSESEEKLTARGVELFEPRIGAQYDPEKEDWFDWVLVPDRERDGRIMDIIKPGIKCGDEIEKPTVRVGWFPEVISFGLDDKTTLKLKEGSKFTLAGEEIEITKINVKSEDTYSFDMIIGGKEAKESMSATESEWWNVFSEAHQRQELELREDQT